MTTIKPAALEEEENMALLRASAALDVDITEALEEREPLPEEIAADEDSRCKYLSKKCIRQRATKAKGELHKLCTFHRAKAIINQRRLELRKRMRNDGDESVTSNSSIDSIEITTESPTRAKKATTKKKAVVMLPTISVPDASMPPAATTSTTKARRPPYKPSPRDVHDIEPCMTPATLFPEDLEELRGLVDLEVTDIGPYYGGMDVAL